MPFVKSECKANDKIQITDKKNEKIFNEQNKNTINK